MTSTLPVARPPASEPHISPALFRRTVDRELVVCRPGTRAHPDAPLFITDPVTFRPTMSCFLKDWAARQPHCATLLAAVAELDSELMRGTDQTAVHRRYCRLLAGESAARVAEHGARWAADVTTDRPVAGLLRDAITDPRRRSAAYLVSDAVDIVASSVMRELGACDVLATRALIDDRGQLTGEVSDPVIGAHRVAALKRFAAARSLDLGRACLLGVTYSDLRMFDVC